jgi:uncharacterized membrane protein YfcA
MSLLAFILVGLICGFVDSALGMGFGVTSASILVAFGVAPAVASASVHTAEAFVDIISAVVHHKLGNVDRRLWLKMMIPGITAAVLGASILSWLSLEAAKPMMRMILLGMGAVVLYRHAFNYRPSKVQMSSNKAILLGFAAGFLDVLGGGGWGPIGTPSLILSGSDPRRAVGTIEFTEPFVSLAAVLTFGFTIGFESFLWNMTIPMIIGGFILTPIAGFLTSKIPRRTLGILIGIWLIALNLYGLLS